MKGWVDFPELTTRTTLRFLKRWMIISLLIHLLAAIYSSGFYQHDEHFQILEFLSLLQRKTSGSALPWEFQNKMRSWAQPMIYFGLSKIFFKIGISSPFTQATLFRMFSSFIGWCSLCSLAVVSRLWVNNTKIYEWIIRGFTLIWFIPFIHARTSGENLGSSFFWIGASLMVLCLEKAKRRGTEPGRFPLLISGVFFGLAFLVRFQIALLLVGVGLWFIFINRSQMKVLLTTAFSFSGVLGLGVLIDHAGYGAWSFPAWNYFNINLIQDKASGFNQEPMWFYFTRCLEYLPPFSSLLLMGSILGCFKKRHHFLIWTILPYFIFHCWISNKDLRFLFPILPISPILVGFGIPQFSLNLKSNFWKGMIKFSVCENLMMLLMVCLRPACSAIPFYSYIYRNFQNGLELYSTKDDPFEMLGLKLNYYLPHNYKSIPKSSMKQIEEKILNSEQPIFVFDDKLEFLDETPELKKYCRERFRILPKWIENFNFNGWLSRSRPWKIYECIKLPIQ